MRATRRDLLRTGVGAATLPALMAAAPALARTAAGSRAELLSSIVSLEQAGALTYDLAADRLAADKPLARALALFADQEREHAGALIPALRTAGGQVPAAPRDAAAVPGLKRALARGRRATLGFAARLEGAAITAQYESQGELRDVDLLRRIASIMGCQAQHQVVLRQALGRDPVPDAFVTGRRR